MAHISKNKPDSGLLQLIFNELSTHIAKVDKRTAPRFLHELLTETEQIMIAKRMTAIVMLSQNIGVYKIATRLQMSTSTVRLIAFAYENGKYDNIVNSINKSKKDKEHFWELIELISRGGLPSRGKDRWKFLNALTE